MSACWCGSGLGPGGAGRDLTGVGGLIHVTAGTLIGKKTRKAWPEVPRRVDGRERSLALVSTIYVYLSVSCGSSYFNQALNIRGQTHISCGLRRQ